ncbi:glycosyltransferase family 39 protein [Verrucomicrobiales bacterium BCK34]|nr:glycosyltransferase family 39 protein [Verrucomicrobiales bacterium BCK34]
MIIALTGFLLTFVLGPLVLMGSVAKVVKEEPVDALSGLSLSIAFFSYPLLIAWLTWLEMLVLPGLSLWCYAIIPIGLTIALGATGGLRRGLGILGEIVSLVKGKLPNRWIRGLIFAGIAGTAFFTLTIGYHANDPMEYQLVANEIAKSGSYENYPLAVTTDEGLYVNASHPPGFHAILVWCKIWQPEGLMLLERLLEIFYLLGLCVTLYLLGIHVGSARSAAYAVFCLIGCPIVLVTVFSVHTDPQRFFFYFSAVVFPFASGRYSRTAATAFSGVVTGMAMFTHSIGILALPAVLLVWILVFGVIRAIKDRKKWGVLALVAVIACVIGGIQFGLNFSRDGVLLADYEPVLELEEFEYERDTAIAREIDTLQGRFVNGGFRPFFDLKLFGLTYLCGLGGIIILLGHAVKKRISPFLPIQEELVVAVICCVWIFSWGVFSYLDLQLPIKNVRYLATPCPLFALMGGRLIDLIHGKVFS